MTNWKVTWFFDAGKTGWTESMYTTADTLEIAFANANSLAALRARLLGTPSQVKISFIRIQGQEDPFLSRGRPVSYDSTGFGDDRPVDMPWTGILVGFRGANSKARRQLILRGVPDAITVQPWWRPPQDDVWNPAFDLWAGAVASGPWLMKVINRTASPLVTFTSVSAAADGSLVVNKNGHGVLEGQLVSFYRVKSQMVCIKGTHKATAVTGTSFQISDIQYGRIFFERGQYRVKQYTYLNMTGFGLEGSRRKLTGRPFGLLVGAHKGCKR